MSIVWFARGKKRHWKKKNSADRASQGGFESGWEITAQRKRLVFQKIGPRTDVENDPRRGLKGVLGAIAGTPGRAQATNNSDPPEIHYLHQAGTRRPTRAVLRFGTGGVFQKRTAYGRREDGERRAPRNSKSVHEGKKIEIKKGGSRKRISPRNEVAWTVDRRFSILKTLC